MLIFLLYAFTIFTIQYLCNFWKYNVLLLIDFVLFIYLFFPKFVHFVVRSVYNMCLCCIRCIPRKTWVLSDHKTCLTVLQGVHKSLLLENLLKVYVVLLLFVTSCLIFDFVYIYIYIYIDIYVYICRYMHIYIHAYI